MKFFSIIAPVQRRSIKLIIYFTLLDMKGVTSSAIFDDIKIYCSFSQSFWILIYPINFFFNTNALLFGLFEVYSIINTLLLRLDQFLPLDDNKFKLPAWNELKKFEFLIIINNWFCLLALWLFISNILFLILHDSWW